MSRAGQSRRSQAVLSVSGSLALAFCLFWGAAAGAAEAGPAEAPPAEPDGYRFEPYRAPTPATLKGARVISSQEAEILWRDKAAVFVDVLPRPPRPAGLPAGTVWRDPPHDTIAGAHWLPNVGFGALSTDTEGYFRAGLAALTEGNHNRLIVIFCLKDCWMSWNAAKRALALGYTHVLWYPEGTDGWAQAGHPLESRDPEPRS